MKRTLEPLILVLALALPIAGRAQSYPPVPPDPPIPSDQLYQLYYPRSHEAKAAKNADLVMQEGLSQTIVFKMLNMTPYRMELTEASKAVLGVHTERDRRTGKSWMFAPVGVPAVLPPGTTSLANTDNVIPGTHPRNFVLAWNNWWWVPRSHLNWVVKDVLYECTDNSDPTTCYSNDQYLGLWITYLEPPDELAAGSYSMIQAIMEEVLALTGVLMDPINPIAWAAFGFTTKNLVVEGIEFNDEQNKVAEGAKIYVSSYVIPDWNRNCFILNNAQTWAATGQTGTMPPPQPCDPSTASHPGEDSDAYEAGWDHYISGDGPAALMVLTSVLRGQAAHATPRGSDANNVAPELGSVPIVSVMVVTGEQYEAAQLSLFLKNRPPMASARPGTLDLDKEKVVKEARKFRDKYGVDDARRALAWTVVALGDEERAVLREAVLTLLERNPISREQEEFLLGVLRQAEERAKESRKEG